MYKHPHQIVPVILCGGSGTRLWPLSRTAFPKQFLVLSGKATLFQQAVERLQSLKNASVILNDTLIVTNEEHRFLVLDQLREMKNVKAHLLLEPIGRNTAPALTLAALQATDNSEDPILVVTPADQTLQDQANFTKSLHNAIEVADKGSIVVLGIKPTKPDTGFGYIKKDISEDEYHAFKVLNFTEKPDLKTAETYLKSGEYFWNGGMFVLRASVWLKTIQHLSPDIYEATLKAFNHKTNDDLFIRPNENLFKSIPANSIDYAVIEKCPQSNFDIRMVELDAGWNDLGSWDAVWQVGDKDKNQNVTYGDTLLENTKNSLVYADHKLVSVVGLDNIVVIETSDAILVMDRNQSQEVKLLVNKLNTEKREEKNLHRKVARPWGWYDSLDEGETFKVKRIQVNPGASLSLQKHAKRAEHWVVVKGVAEVLCNDKKITLKENESTYIPLGHTHRLSNLGKDVLEIIEVQSGSYLGEDDIERFDDSYGRVKN
ncbi:{ManC} Mannose-1-phosphate guanylyltransferase [Candidatus Methylopumilus universalis]|uniref:mannose-1-phosphate guanylyltransferase/mannose-6-phosphate isomerase n=1 Tax=Candidatus Methylopumilus universalis TaxID=2588536 RepID=UPI003BEED2E6